MSVEDLLSRLTGVRRTGANRWIARCPAHSDNHPSLALRLLDDGRILLHDFAGCDIEVVLANLGLTFTDLFPARDVPTHLSRVPRPFPANDVLQCLTLEVLIVHQVAKQLQYGSVLSSIDYDRLLTAIRRSQAAERLINE